MKVKLVPHFSLQQNVTVMVPGCHWRQRAGYTRYIETVKMSNLFSLLVVLQMGQDPSRWAQDGHGEHAQCNSSFLDVRKRGLSQVLHCYVKQDP